MGNAGLFQAARNAEELSLESNAGTKGYENKVVNDSARVQSLNSERRKAQSMVEDCARNTGAKRWDKKVSYMSMAWHLAGTLSRGAESLRGERVGQK